MVCCGSRLDEDAPKSLAEKDLIPLFKRIFPRRLICLAEEVVRLKIKALKCTKKERNFKAEMSEKLDT